MFKIIEENITAEDLEAVTTLTDKIVDFFFPTLSTIDSPADYSEELGI
jgi:hypothetical protein